MIEEFKLSGNIYFQKDQKTPKGSKDLIFNLFEMITTSPTFKYVLNTKTINIDHKAKIIIKHRKSSEKLPEVISRIVPNSIITPNLFTIVITENIENLGSFLIDDKNILKECLLDRLIDVWKEERNSQASDYRCLRQNFSNPLEIKKWEPTCNSDLDNKVSKVTFNIFQQIQLQAIAMKNIFNK